MGLVGMVVSLGTEVDMVVGLDTRHLGVHSRAVGRATAQMGVPGEGQVPVVVVDNGHMGRQE